MKKLSGIETMSHEQQKRQIKRDIDQWLKAGNKIKHINQYNPKTVLSVSDYIKMYGFYYEG